MIGESHHQAETLAAEATTALANGCKSEALELYLKAADFERAALIGIPLEKQRTRSIISVSLVSLLYKSRKFNEAELEIFGFLASRQLLPWAEQQLRELLEVVTDERILQEKLRLNYTGDSFTISLRGGEIGTGTAPLDLILDKATGFKNLFYRFAEYEGNYPLRLRGVPPKELIDFMQVRATQPSIGSYRFEIRLTEPSQLELFDKPRVRPQDVSNLMFAFIHALNMGTAETIEVTVPDAGYRKALLELTRSVVPRGKRITEIGIYRRKDDHTESVYLTPALSEKVRKIIPQKPQIPGAEYQELHGVLRAVHLDENWLEITLPGGQHEKCDTMPDMLDDVVGPMVNHEVIVQGMRRTKRGGIRRLHVDDIELSEPD